MGHQRRVELLYFVFTFACGTAQAGDALSLTALRRQASVPPRGPVTVAEALKQPAAAAAPNAMRGKLAAECEAKKATSCFEAANLALSSERLADATRWYGAACDGALADACARLARVQILVAKYDLGIGSYERGCSLGDSASCSQAADMKANGYGATRKLSPGAAKLEKSCLAGDAASCPQAALALDEEKSVEDAVAMLQKGCALGLAVACTGYAHRLTLLEKITESRPAFQRGCALGDGQACHDLGEMLFKEGNREAANELYRKGCQQGSRAACDDVPDPVREARELIRARDAKRAPADEALFPAATDQKVREMQEQARKATR